MITINCYDPLSVNGMTLLWIAQIYIVQVRTLSCWNGLGMQFGNSGKYSLGSQSIENTLI